MRTKLMLFAAAFVLAAAAEAADAPKPVLFRGTITSFDGKAMTITTATGPVSGAVTADTRYSAVEALTLAQLKPTDFVGITAHDGPNGHLVAEEIHVIPIVGMGEGQYPWDHHPDNADAGPTRAGSMTNGTITTSAPMRAGSMTNGTVTGGSSNALTVTFHGSGMVDGKCVGHAAPGGTGCVGTAIVDVTPKTYIQSIVPATVADVKAGETAVGRTGAAPDGSATIASITVEKNGVKPEF
jgi:hypothetical protein